MNFSNSRSRRSVQERDFHRVQQRWGRGHGIQCRPDLSVGLGIRCREEQGSETRVKPIEGEWGEMVGAVRFELTTF